MITKNSNLTLIDNIINGSFSGEFGGLIKIKIFFEYLGCIVVSDHSNAYLKSN